MNHRLPIAAGLATSVLIHAGAVYTASRGLWDGDRSVRVAQPDGSSWSGPIEIPASAPPATLPPAPLQPDTPSPLPPPPEAALKPIEPKPEPVPEEKKPEDAHDLKIGVESSPHKTDTWLGSANPTPHEAPKSDVEQPDAAKKPGSPEPGSALPPAAEKTPVVAPANPAPTPTPATPDPSRGLPPTETSPLTTPTPSASIPAAEASERPGEAAEAKPIEPALPLAPVPIEAQPGNAPTNENGNTSTSSPAPTPITEPLPISEWGANPLIELVRPLLKKLQLAARPPAAAATPPPANPPAAASSAMTAKPADAGGNASGAEKGKPGPQSTRDSDPFALKDTLAIKPGQLAAAEGLEIETVKPEFSYVTQLTARPKNPIVEIKFNSKGAVESAEFYKGFDTGSRDVDDPILQAAHRWTIKGKLLDELRRDNPSGFITIRVRMLIN